MRPTPENLAALAVNCRKAGDVAGEAEALLLLQAYGFNEHERRRLCAGESLDEVLGCSPSTTPISANVVH